VSTIQRFPPDDEYERDGGERWLVTFLSVVK
jgi:hypothetical protein